MKKIIAICGATASGKTALAVECARHFDGEVISCDALLVYRGLNIGTAKPTKEEMKGVVHHLIDVADPRDNFSVYDFERLALPAVEDIISRGKTPILGGGTGFYINAILFESGYGHVGANETVREKYRQYAGENGREALHALLAACDPESAEMLHSNDVKRVIRALEIYELTGKRKSEQADSRVPRYPYVAFAVDWPREELYARIDHRTQVMLDAGLVGEVEGLLSDGVPEDAQCMQGIGYKEVVESLKNRDLQSNMRDIIMQHTRNYAKRQLTFFKKMPGLHWLKSPDLQMMVGEIEEIYDS